ncbi:MAG TPA: DNA polymerase III subunit beta, partial [Rhodanobacter sp.]|nr:DNA polymerase III subunit beta [Rhodanobacter sp.]
EAVEEVEAETQVSELAVGFNVGYLLDALGALRGEKARLSLRDAQSSCLVQEQDNEQARHVIMPLRL